MNQTNEDVEGIKIYCFIGHSDDVLEEDKTGLDCDCVDKEGRFSLRRPNGEGVLITGQYRENGCWHIGVSLLDESRPLVLADGWKFSLLPTSYNNELLVYAPVDAELTCLNNEEESDD